MAKRTQEWRNRIVGYDNVPADQLLANPFNWRGHPKAQQDTLTGVLDDVGWVQEIIVNQTTGHIIDGHMRVELAISRNENVPIKYVDLTEEEEALILATFDPISAMAFTDAAQLETLLTMVNSDSAAVQAMLAQLAGDNGIVPSADSEWVGMPEMEQDTINSFHSLIIHFKSNEDMQEFAELIGQPVTINTRYKWYPKHEDIDGLNHRVIDES